MKKEKIQKLTKAEEDIMKMLWSHGPTTVSAMIDKMKGEKPPHSTVSSIIRILEKKGFVDHNTYGRTYEYYPIIEKEIYSKFSLKSLLSNYFEGSVNEMVSFLIKEEEVNVDELKKLIDDIKE